MLLAALSVVCGAEAKRTITPNNPILKSSDEGFIYLADPAAEVFDGRVYVYCSHDQPNAKNYGSMQDYAIVSSKDLKSWTNHGVVVKPREFSWADGQMNAPDAAYKDGWYYLYFPFNKAYIGVVKSRNPEGPWEEAVNKAITKIFDPTVFVDDDGQAYIYGNLFDAKLPDRYIVGAKLKDNMLELDGEWQRLSDETVNEAVHIFKRNGIYYFTARKGSQTGYFMANEPLPTEPRAEFKGYITKVQHDAPAHNSFIEFKKRWYIFYHRGDVNKGTRCRRSACFEEIRFNEDGTIVPIEYSVDEKALNVNL